MENSSKIDELVSVAKVHSDRLLEEPLPIRTSRWAFWRAPMYVNLSWLQKQAEFVEQAAEVEFCRVALESELAQIQKKANLDNKATKRMKKLVKMIDWASRSSKRNQSQMIPGIGLEFCVITSFVGLGLANLLI